MVGLAFLFARGRVGFQCLVLGASYFVDCESLEKCVSESKVISTELICKACGVIVLNPAQGNVPSGSSSIC